MPPTSSSSSSSTSTTSIWSDLPRRLLTICLGVPAIWKILQQPVLAYIFFAGAHFLSAWEFTLLEPTSSSANATNGDTSRSPSKWQRLGFCVVSVALASIYVPNLNDDNININPHHGSVSTSLFTSMLALTGGIFVMMRRLHWVTGLVLLTIPFRFWTLLQWRKDDDGFAHTVSILLVVWNADTGALLMGRIASILHKQFPSWQRWPVPRWIHIISPKKSMEGFLGGVLGGVWTAVQWVPGLVRWRSMETSAAFEAVWMTSSWQQRVGLGLILSLLAILGDLVESSVKRQSQAKDSGSVLPGHGGILDRFDSSLLAVCFYHVLLERLSSS